MASFKRINIRSTPGRLFGLIFFAAAIIASDYADGTFWLWRGIGYEQTVYAPFMTLLLISAVSALILGNNPIKTTQDVSVPIGVITSCCNILLVFTDMDEPSKLTFDLRLMYAPLVLGLIISYLLQIFFEDSAKKKSSSTGNNFDINFNKSAIHFCFLIGSLDWAGKRLVLGFS